LNRIGLADGGRSPDLGISDRGVTIEGHQRHTRRSGQQLGVPLGKISAALAKRLGEKLSQGQS
jgi:hypothetical protein